MKFKVAMIFMLIAIVAAIAYAAGPGKGTIEKRSLTIKGSNGESCSADSVTIRWNLDSLFGEPVVNGSWKWTGSGNCEAHYSTCVFLKIQSGNTYGFIKIAPAVPKANKGYGFNTAGSPDWDEVICGYNGTKKENCLSEKDAKDLWLNGRITDFDIVSD